MNFRKLRRNVKAISPVISVLLMIAVAVAAALVTYAWVMGYLGFTTTKVGKAIVIQSVSVDGNIYVQNVGESVVVLSGSYVDGLAVGTLPADPELSVGETGTITVSGANYAESTHTFKVTTEDGTFAEITKTFP
ncbi:MAG TPA: archaellin/type IV pilin N-terminal domain-containing protein [Candidatus Bathyarchaeia archaeon]|nr:archaellin/type IV pilin N-terminal domain-containing protein [Candidatus Bathyarchaeia archaeon]